MGAQCSCIQSENSNPAKGESDSGRIQTLQVDPINRSIIEDSLTSGDSVDYFSESNGLFSPSNALPKARPYFPRFRSFDSDIKSVGEESDDSWKKTVSFSQFISHESKMQVSRKEFVNPKYGNVWGMQNIALRRLVHKIDNEYLWEAENNELETKCSTRFTLFESSQLLSEDLTRLEALLRQVSSIQCQNFAQIYSFGIYEQTISKKVYYIVVVNQEMGSCSVREIWDMKHYKGQKWSEQEILHVLYGVLDGLIMCTHFNITNDKLKLDNLMFHDETGAVMLTDFDLKITGMSTTSTKTLNSLHRKSIFGKLRVKEEDKFLEPSMLSETDRKSLLNLLFKLIGPDDTKASVETIQATDKCMKGYTHIFELLQFVAAKKSLSEIREFLTKNLHSFDASKSFKKKKSIPKISQSQTIETFIMKFDAYFWVGNFAFAYDTLKQLLNLFTKSKGRLLAREYQQYMKCGTRLLKYFVESTDFLKAKDLAHDLHNQFKVDEEFKKVLRSGPSEYINFTFLIGNVYDGLKETDLAIKFYSKGIKHCGQKKIRTENYKTVLKRIATLLLDKNKEAEALSYFKKLALLNPITDKVDSEGADVYLMMGEISKSQGNIKQAIKFYLQAWDAMKNERMREDLVLKRIDIATRISDNYVTINEEQNAIMFEIESQNLKKKVYGKESQEYQKSLKKVAEMHIKIKNYEGALGCYEVLSNLLKKAGEGSINEYNESISYLADMYFIGSHYKEAFALYKQYAEIIEKNEGIKSKKYLCVQDNMAKTLYKSEIYKTSLDIQLANYQAKKQLYYPNDIAIVIALNNLGHTYYALNNYEKALESHLKSLEIYDSQTPGKKAEGREQILLSIALDYRKLDNLSKGLEYIYECLTSGAVDKEIITNPESALEFYDTVGERQIIGLNFDSIARET